MSFDRFTHQFVIAAPASEIYAHLMVPENYIGLSPLVVAVRDVTPEGYTAIERFRFGPFKYDNPIKVRLTGAEPDRRVVSSVKSPGWVTLLATTQLEPDGDRTRVTDVTEVTSPWFLRWFVAGQARSVQQKRAVELTRRMEA